MKSISRCAASLFKVLCTDTNFLAKLRKMLAKCCHEATIDNCYKSRVALQVTAREVITFFLEISTISDYITQFPDIVARRSGDLQIMLLAISRNRLRGWCAAKFDQLVSCASRQKVREPLICLTCLNFFSIDSGPHKIQVCKYGLQH